MTIARMMNGHQSIIEQNVYTIPSIPANISKFGVDIRKNLVYSENHKKAFTKRGDLSAEKGGYYPTAGGEYIPAAI